MIRFDRFTLKAQEAVQELQSIAEKHEHQAVDVEHLLYALISQKLKPFARYDISYCLFQFVIIFVIINVCVISSFGIWQMYMNFQK